MSEQEAAVMPAVEGVVESGQGKEEVKQALAENQADQLSQKVDQQADPDKPTENDRFAARFAALSRQEKALRDREAQLKQTMAEWEEQQKSAQEKAANAEALSKRLKSEPLKLLEENGITMQDLADLVLNDGNPTPDMKIKRLKDEMQTEYKSELQQLKEEFESYKQKVEEQQDAEILDSFKSELTDYVNSNEEYELIRANDAVDLVFDVIDQHYQESGELLETEQAAKAVENYLEEEARKILAVKKLASTEPSGEEGAEPSQAQGQESVTLSNTEASQVPNRSERSLSDEESKAEIAKLLQWVD
jgi:hypothetical protein